MDYTVPIDVNNTSEGVWLPAGNARIEYGRQAQVLHEGKLFLPRATFEQFLVDTGVVRRIAPAVERLLLRAP